MSEHAAFETLGPKVRKVGRQGRRSYEPVPSSPVREHILERRPMALGVILLLVSAAFTEVASNIVFVVVVEQAYQLGNGATAIGIVLIVQAAAQVIFGSWAGGLTDRWGFRKAAGIAALVTFLLLPALAIAQDILVVYVLAFFFMLARLLLIPARFGLVSQVSDKSSLIQTNTAVLIVAGAGSFIGPAIAAGLLLATNDFGLALMLAGAGWILSVPPLVMIKVKPELPVADRRSSFFDEIQSGWRLIRRRITISQVLVCLILAALFLGAITPLFTPLSRQLGLGTGGTGVFFSALGFGYLIGPLVATALFKRIRLSSALLIAGFLAPIGLVLVGTLESLAGILIAIALVSASGAGVNVIVTTITQRLTPPNRRGSVLGTEQTLIGLAWIVSLGVITVLTAAWDAESNVRLLFLILGGIGFVSILSCWLWNKGPTREVCALCKPRFAISPVACGMLQGVPFGLAHAACSVICGKGCQRCT